MGWNLKIAIAVSEYHRRGGFPRYGAQLATGLAGRGHSVTVFTQRAEIEERDRDIQFRFYSTVGGPRLLHMALEPMVVTRWARRARGDFDAVLAVGLPCLAPVVLFGPGTHRGSYVTLTGSLSWRSPRRWGEAIRPFHKVVLAWERAMLAKRHPELVVVPNEHFAQEYVDFYRFPREKIALLPLAVEVGEFAFDPGLREVTRRALGVDDSTILFLSVAGRGRQKGLDVLTQALARLPASLDWRMAFAGKGSTQHSLKSGTMELRSQGRVMLLGEVSSVHGLYCAADLLVFPSRYDPWGLVVTEALSCGLPVVASSHIGAAVAVKEHVNGVLIDHPGDQAEVCERILDAVGLLRSFDRQRVSESVSRLSPDAVSKQLEGILLGSASTSPHPPGRGAGTEPAMEVKG